MTTIPNTNIPSNGTPSSDGPSKEQTGDQKYTPQVPSQGNPNHS